MTLISKTLLKLGLAAQRNHRWEPRVILLGLLCLLTVQLKGQSSNGGGVNPATVPCLGSNAVQWRDLFLVSVNADNSLSLSSNHGGGAASENMLEANTDGWMEFTLGSMGMYSAAGLSYTNVDASKESIDYSVYTYGDGQVFWYEAGVIQASFYALPTDVFRVARVGNQIHYSRNGVVTRTVSTDASRRLLVDVAVSGGGVPVIRTSFCVPVQATATIVATGCGLSDGSITLNTYSGTPPYSYAWNDGVTSANRTGLASGTYSVRVGDASGGFINYSYNVGNKIQWRDLVGVSVNADNNLTKSSSAGDGWNAGAASENMLEAGQDGWIEWVGISFVVGLSHVNTDADETFVDYAMSGTGTPNQLALKEKGVNVATFNGFQYSDVFRIERVGSNIRYLRNGTLLRSVATDASKRLLVDVSIWSSNGTLPIIRTSFCGSISYVWNGSVSSNWAVAANWTPNGVPSSLDDITIVSAPNPVSLDASRSVRNCTLTSGQLSLGTFNLTITGQANLTAGQVNGGSLTCQGTVTTLGNASAGPVLATALIVNSATLTLQHTTFSGIVNLTKTGSSDDQSRGSNTFQSTLSLSNSGSGKLVMGLSSGDTFLGPVTFSTSGTGGVFLAHSSSGTLFQQEVRVNSSAAGGIAFGAAGGLCQLANGYRLLVGSSGFTAGDLVLKGFSQVGVTPQNLVLTGTAGLRIGAGSVFAGPVDFTTPRLYLDGATYANTATFTKTGSGTDNCAGGNTFRNTLRLVNLSIGVVNMVTVNDDLIN